MGSTVVLLLSVIQFGQPKYGLLCGSLHVLESLVQCEKCMAEHGRGGGTQIQIPMRR